MPNSPASPSLSRRGLLAAGGAAGLGALLAACGSDSGSDSGSGKGGAWSFTDDRNKKIKLDAAPKRVVAYIGTAAALHDFGAGDQIVGVFGPTKKKNGEPDVLAGELDVKKLEIIGNAYGEFDIEKYAKVRARAAGHEHVRSRTRSGTCRTRARRRSSSSRRRWRMKTAQISMTGHHPALRGSSPNPSAPT